MSQKYPMRGKILFVSLAVYLFLWVSNLCAMECRIINDEGNTINSATAGEMVYFEGIYAYSKPKKLAWNLMIALPSVDKKNYKTSIKHNGYFFHDGSLENKSHFVPIVIPRDNFIEGYATFKYTLASNGNCVVYLNVLQDAVPPYEPVLTATAVTSGLINLSWTVGTDNTGVVGYRIYCGDGTYQKSETGTSTYFDGLNAGTQYCYTVTAFDATGNESAHSNTACVTTPEPTPEPTREPIPEPTPEPEPIDCCPDQASVLRCGDCTESNPCIAEEIGIKVYCTGDTYAKPYWYMKIGWGVILIDVEPYDTSCCPAENTGICYEMCNQAELCQTLYATQPTEWFIYSDQYNNWYVYSATTYNSYRLLREGVQ